MRKSYRRRLLSTTLPVAMEPPAFNTSMASSESPPTADEILDACKKLMSEPRPRWVGGNIPGILIEADQGMPDGWFGLRQPDEHWPYAGPLPLASFAVFYRGGDVVRLSPSNAARLANNAALALLAQEADDA